MHNFFFNHECLPTVEEKVGFTQLFETTLRAFDSLLSNQELNVSPGIITEKPPTEMGLGNEFTLADVINGLDTQAMRTLAYKYFTRFPIDDCLVEGDGHEITETEMEEADHFFWETGGNEHSCFYLFLAERRNGLVFTVPILDTLAVHPLQIRNKTEPPIILQLPNLYSQEENTRLIKEELITRNRALMDLFSQLESILESPITSNRFKKDFSSLTIEEKQSVIENFERAKNRGLPSPFYPDTSLVKETTGTNKCKVYELRIFEPTALRVYFLEHESRVFLGTIKKKSNPDQNKDIKKAEDIIHKLMLTIP